MSEVVMNAREFMAGLDKFVGRFQQRFQKRNRILVTQAMRRLIRRTPVHTGQTVRSYIASNGRPITTGPAPAGKPVEPTNPLPLGAERLRGGAEAQAVATLNSVSFDNPFDVFYIVNKSPAVAGLEAGELPEEPYTPRSPQGMFAVTLQELSLLVNTGLV